MAFKMKHGKGRSSFPYKTPLNKKHDDDVLSKEIKDTRELSEKAQEKSRRGGIGPEESPEAIAKKEKDFLEAVKESREDFMMSDDRNKPIATSESRPAADRAMALSKEYDEAYRYKKEPGKKSPMKKDDDGKKPPYIGERKIMGGEEYVWLKGDIYGDGTWVVPNEATKEAEHKAMMNRIKANREAGVYDPDYDGSVEPEYER
tara:strand:+ start:431 stop:1039 length:609 start_codon:yes stop_codon:yes gene_type:complete